MIARGRPICLDYIRIELREGEKSETVCVCVCGRELTCRLRPTRAAGDATLDTHSPSGADLTSVHFPVQDGARWTRPLACPAPSPPQCNATRSQSARRAWLLLADQRGGVTMTTAEAVCDNSRRSSAAFRERRLGRRFPNARRRPRIHVINVKTLVSVLVTGWTVLLEDFNVRNCLTDSFRTSISRQHM